MERPPAPLLAHFPNHTADNDSEGIAKALAKLGLISA